MNKPTILLTPELRNDISLGSQKLKHLNEKRDSILEELVNVDASIVVRKGIVYRAIKRAIDHLSFEVGGRRMALSFWVKNVLYFIMVSLLSRVSYSNDAVKVVGDGRTLKQLVSDLIEICNET